MNNDRAGRLRWFVHDFANMDWVELSEGEWAALRKQLFRHLYPDEKLTKHHEFQLIDKRSVAAAQFDVKAIVRGIAQDNVRNMPDPRTYGSGSRWRKDVALWRRQSARRAQHLVHFGTVKLSNLEFRLIRAPDGTVQKRPGLDYNNPDGRGFIKASFMEALTEMGTRAEQIMMCQNQTCQKLFVSLRKPRRDRNAHYCSVHCCHVESRRRYLEDPMNRKKERERNRARYKIKARRASRSKD